MRLTSRRLIVILLAALFLVVGAFIGIISLPLPLEKFSAPQATRFYDRNEELIQVIISDDGFFRLAVNLNDLPDLLIDTLILQEDQYFFQHPGVNPFAIARALLGNVASGRVVSGASTITMQLARMLERKPRTVFVKLIEMFRALQLEHRYSKLEILQAYLSIAPYGGNLEGLHSATYAYFGKPTKQLSAAQIALLVVIPKSPNSLRPDRHPEMAKLKRDTLLHKMAASGLIDRSTLMHAIDEPIPNQRLSFPAKIPHLAWYLKSQHPHKTDFYTSLDSNVQLRTEQMVRQYVGSLKDQGIQNASAVVIDTATREVRAMIGSADYFDIPSEGANNGAVALRSPGSTLKPFLYGLAMDDGLIAEKTKLADIPLSVAGYKPSNYSKTFRGHVTVREALIDSLNVVAVRLSQQLGIEKLYGLLKAGGITTLEHPPGYYGLPLVLGGVEISLLELTNLYAALANYGEYLPYKILTTGQPEQPPIHLLSPEASWLVGDILTDVERPDFPSIWQYSSSRPTVAWKTGTSYGHQDAWSVGYHPEYTVGVWVGNFSGAPASRLSGNHTAAPLFFDIVQAIVQQPTHWFAKPVGIERRAVCDVCGLPGNAFCPNNTVEQYLPAVIGPVTLDTCQVRQQITTSLGTQVVDVWPSELATFFHAHGLPVAMAPAYDIRNMAGARYFKPRIQSPVAGAEYIRRPNLTVEDQQIKLQAAVTNRIKRVRWFLDEKLIIESDQPYASAFINPPPGEYQLTLIDDVGGSDSVPLVIKDYRALMERDR